MKSKIRRLCLYAVVMTIYWLQPGQSAAQTVIWNNFSGSPDPFYHHGGNWVGFTPPGSSATARFDSPFTYEVWWNGSTESSRPSVGKFHVVDGNVTLINQDTFTQRQLTINNGPFNGLSISGDPLTRLETQGVHLNVVGGAEILDGARLTINGSHNAGTNFTVAGAGLDVSGNFRVESGAIADSNWGYIARVAGSTGTATITGVGSQWNNSQLLFVGGNGNGTLNVTDNATVSTYTAHIGYGSSSAGDANVNTGGYLNASNALFVGVSSGATNTLDVYTGGVVDSGTGFIGHDAGSSGTATISGAGSQWNNSLNLYVGGSSTSAGGNGTLNINTDGLVTVGGTTKIWSTGTVNLNGGQFDFGQTSFTEFDTINANSGIMNGTVNHSGFTDVASMNSLNNTAVDLTGVTLSNTGTVHGNGTIGVTTNNQAAGELFVAASDMLRMTAAGNTNAGEINNFGGTVRFDQDATNLNGGFIAGRGQFVADGGWTNQGVMAFSGTTDVLGDLVNDTGGQIVTSGGATTTFFDDVVHNGTEIRTAEGSATVFFGDQSGAGAFTGTGTVYYEGDLRPGNSPDVVDYEGSVVFGTGAGSFFEIGGTVFGDYDRLSIQGDLALAGNLTVDLINGFDLGFNQQFLIADVGGLLSGQYDGLGEGSLVGNFGGQDLFITYAGGDGNDVTLYSVPEPGTVGICASLFVPLAMIRRRRLRNL